MSSEYLQFVGMLILFAGIIIGSYWFVYAPTRRSERESRRQAEEQPEEREG